MLQISNIKTSIKSSNNLKNKIIKLLKVKESFITNIEIIKRSIDARNKNNILFVYTLKVKTKDDKYILSKKINNVILFKEEKLTIEKVNSKKRVAVVGYGPSGIFASLCLAESGVSVSVFERGSKIKKRDLAVDKFISSGVLNPESNVQFGEGGAGTYSDGKLTSRTKNIYTAKVFAELIEAGASKEISVVNNPHIGTDLLKDVVTNIRKKAEKLGVDFNFNSKVEDLVIENGSCKGLVVNGKKHYYDYLVLAIGHSARDTVKMLNEKKIKMENKAFSLGFRIEHKKETIDKSQFGDNYKNELLGAGEYRLTNQINNRGVYTFCMCPGGMVIPASSSLNTVVVNGMSYQARDLENSNSALLVTVEKNEFGEQLFSGMDFQKKVEETAFKLGGSDYKAPVQRVEDFILDRESQKLGEIVPSYKIGYKLTNLRSLYPEFINQAIIDSLPKLNNKLKGFNDEDAILTGVETRSSSTVRIVRNEDMCSCNTKNLFLIGEGAGYAGGIISASMDGVKVSLKIIEFLKNVPKKVD